MTTQSRSCGNWISPRLVTTAQARCVVFVSPFSKEPVWAGRRDLLLYTANRGLTEMCRVLFEKDISSNTTFQWHFQWNTLPSWEIRPHSNLMCALNQSGSSLASVQDIVAMFLSCWNLIWKWNFLCRHCKVFPPSLEAEVPAGSEAHTEA